MRTNAMVAAFLVGLMLAITLLAVVWTPYDPIEVNLGMRLRPPSIAHWLGTDEFGRDVLSRVMTGASVSVLVAFATVASATTVGTVIGILTGYMQGWVDRTLMALNDALLAFPGILLALAILTILGSGITSIVIALGIAYTPSVVRVVRGTVLSVRQRDFVEASRVMGNGESFTMLRHVLPNCLAPVTVMATSMLGWALLSESALSFLGIGVPPPAPTWGSMLAASRPYMQFAAWLEIAPGLCIAVTLLGINMLGDALRDQLDPRMRPT